MGDTSLDVTGNESREVSLHFVDELCDAHELDNYGSAPMEASAGGGQQQGGWYDNAVVSAKQLAAH